MLSWHTFKENLRDGFDYDAQKGAFYYITQMSSTTGIPLEESEFKQNFLTEENLILDDKKEVNKKLFDIGEKLKDTESDVSLSDQDKEMIESSLNLHIKQKINTLKNEHRAGMDSYKRYSKEAEKFYLQAVKKLEELELLENSEGKNYKIIEKRIKEIEKTGLWKLQKIEKGAFSNVAFLHFHSTFEASHRIKDSKSGTDISVNYGKVLFKFPLDLTGQTVERCTPIDTEKAFYIQNNWSNWCPFITKSGEICWGNKASDITRAMGDLRFPYVMKCLHSLLTVYDGAGGPYISLQSFHKEYVRAKERDEYLKMGKWCEECEKPHKTCSCRPPRQECECGARIHKDCKCPCGPSTEYFYYCQNCDFEGWEEDSEMDICPDCGCEEDLEIINERRN